MGLETELKYLNADQGAVREALGTLGAKPLGRDFEENLVFDDPACSLRRRGLLLRLRRTGRGAWLTVKEPARPQGPFKAAQEHETAVADFGAARAALEALGYQPAFAYEKVRESWSLAGCTVCLDRLPFDDFVEIEGPAEALRPCAASLGLADCLTSRETYHALNRAWRRTRGLPEDENFVFAEPLRSKLLAELAGTPGHPAEG